MDGDLGGLAVGRQRGVRHGADETREAVEERGEGGHLGEPVDADQAEGDERERREQEPPGREPGAAGGAHPVGHGVGQGHGEDQALGARDGGGQPDVRGALRGGVDGPGQRAEQRQRDGIEHGRHGPAPGPGAAGEPRQGQPRQRERLRPRGEALAQDERREGHENEEGLVAGPDAV